MNELFKISKLLLLLLFLNSCGSVGEALQGKKRSEQGDEFLIDKKNPLSMPPDYDLLPLPGEASATSTKEITEDNTNIKELLKLGEIDDNITTTEDTTSIESLILKKIK